jgi:hypothetical protein
MSITKPLTIGEARISFDSLLSSFTDSKPLNESDLQKSFSGISTNLNFRDYVLGSVGFGLSDYSDRIAFLNLFSVCGDSADIEAIKSSFHFEAEKKSKALSTVEKALKLDPSHGLSKLLKRVYESSAPSNFMADCRNQLHGKVLAQVEAEALEVLGA